MEKKINVLDVVPKELSFIIELTELQLLQLKLLFDHAQIDYDGEKEPIMNAAVEFLNKSLYPFLKKIEEKQLGEL